MPLLNDLISPEDERYLVKLAISTYLVGQMINTPTNNLNGDEAKQAKVEAAKRYADLLMQG